MKKKEYYTPEKDEIHYGMEVEFYYMEGFGEKWYWQPLCVDIECFQFAIYKIEDGGIRVKYLDREGTESLGWHKVREDKGGSVYFENGNGFSLSVKDDFVFIVKNPFTILFSGKIKNKSELKKIMQHTGIIK